MLVEFLNVGRDKKSWTEELKSLTENTLRASVRKNHALASRDVEFGVSDVGWPPSGTVIVGGMRAVGTWRVVPEESPHADA